MYTGGGIDIQQSQRKVKWWSGLESCDHGRRAVQYPIEHEFYIDGVSTGDTVVLYSNAEVNELLNNLRMKMMFMKLKVGGVSVYRRESASSVLQ